MSNKDNFGIGFLLGTIFGGIVGGVIGTLIASKNKENLEEQNNTLGTKNIQNKVRNTEDIIETKSNLEEKINQLNHAIDEVRFTLLNNTETEVQEK